MNKEDNSICDGLRQKSNTIIEDGDKSSHEQHSYTRDKVHLMGVNGRNIYYITLSKESVAFQIIHIKILWPENKKELVIVECIK